MAAFSCASLALAPPCGATAVRAHVGHPTSRLYVPLGFVDQMPGAYTPAACSGVTVTPHEASVPILKLLRHRAYRSLLQPAPVADSRSNVRVLPAWKMGRIWGEGVGRAQLQVSHARLLSTVIMRQWLHQVMILYRLLLIAGSSCRRPCCKESGGNPAGASLLPPPPPAPAPRSQALAGACPRCCPAQAAPPTCCAGCQGPAGRLGQQRQGQQRQASLHPAAADARCC